MGGRSPAPHVVRRVSSQLKQDTYHSLSVLAFRYRALASGLYKTNSIRKNVPYWLFVKKYWPRLLGSTGSFFFSQFVGYPGGTFGGIIIAGLSPNGTMVNTIAYSMLLAAFNIPGLLLGAWCTGFMDRRYQLALGFGGQVLLGCLIGGFYDRIVTILPLFIVLYGVYLSIGGEFWDTDLSAGKLTQKQDSVPVT